jgi:hypothetical protein
MKLFICDTIFTAIIQGKVMQFSEVISINQASAVTVKTSEVNDLCEWLRSLLAELKGYFTSAERDSWCPAYLASYKFTVEKVGELARSKCRSAEAMKRRSNMLARCDSELSGSYADYLAEID